MNLDALRKNLFDELEKLNNLDLTNSQAVRHALEVAQVKTNVCDTILASARIELDFCKMMERTAPLSQFVPRDLHEEEIMIAARRAVAARRAWVADNPDKVREIQEAQEKRQSA